MVEQRTDRDGRSSRPGTYIRPGGIFGGNKSVKYGLFAIAACVLIIELINRVGQAELTGPIDDVFRRSPGELVIVYGTRGESPDILRDYSMRVSELLGRNLESEILVYPDTSAGEELLEDRSVLLYGPVENNLVTAAAEDRLPFEFEDNGVRIGGRFHGSGENWRLVFAMPNPYNSERYFLVYTGSTDSSVIGINFVESPNFVHHDTTDYVLAKGGEIVEQGYFDKSDDERWRYSP